MTQGLAGTLSAFDPDNPNYVANVAEFNVQTGMVPRSNGLAQASAQQGPITIPTQEMRSPITIPVQEFDTAAQNAACEQTSFNPWHSNATHKPLGTVNRMRRVVYETISELRKSMNGGATQ